MAKVSVVIPVYGVELFIERCARSLFEQTLDDIEFIFVNDCTPDRSVQILEEIIAEYSGKLTQHHHKVQIVHMPQNGGLHKVRRYGLQFCTGEYIAHCDSDDWVDKDMYRQMYEKARLDDADMVICEYYMSDGQTRWISNPASFNDKYDLLHKCYSRQSSWAVWNKMARRKFYDEDFKYPTGVMGEDCVITTQLILRSTHISHVDAPLYYYYVNNTSITHATSKDTILKKHTDVVANTQIVIDELAHHDLALRYKEELDSIKFHNKSILRPLIQEPQNYKKWKKSYSEINYTIFFNRYISFREKVVYLLLILRIKN